MDGQAAREAAPGAPLAMAERGRALAKQTRVTLIAQDQACDRLVWALHLRTRLREEFECLVECRHLRLCQLGSRPGLPVTVQIPGSRRDPQVPCGPAKMAPIETEIVRRRATRICPATSMAPMAGDETTALTEVATAAVSAGSGEPAARIRGEGVGAPTRSESWSECASNAIGISTAGESGGEGRGTDDLSMELA